MGEAPQVSDLFLRQPGEEAELHDVEELGIQLSTARGVLRAVFRKTGTHRQSSLVRLILSGPGQVRVGPAGARSTR